MYDDQDKDSKRRQLGIRLQNLKVLLEQATLHGNSHRVKILLADIDEVEQEIRHMSERENL